MGSSPSEAENAPPSGWILYDGSCGFCSAGAKRWGPMLRRLGFELAPLQEDWVAKKFEMPAQELISTFRALLPNGEKLAGPDVYRKIFSKIWWARPLYLLSLMPGFRWIFNQSYQFVAGHRHLISRTCGITPEKR